MEEFHEDGCDDNRKLGNTVVSHTPDACALTK